MRQCSRIDTLCAFSARVYILYISFIFRYVMAMPREMARLLLLRRTHDNATGGVHETAPLVLIMCPGTKSSPVLHQRHAALNGEALLRCKWNRLAVRFIPGMVLLLASKHAAADSGLLCLGIHIGNQRSRSSDRPLFPVNTLRFATGVQIDHCEADAVGNTRPDPFQRGPDLFRPRVEKT
jgi:hypothetical protein